MAPEVLGVSNFVVIAAGEVVTGTDLKGREASITGPITARAIVYDELPDVVTLQTFGRPEIKLQIPLNVYDSWSVRGQQ